MQESQSSVARGALQAIFAVFLGLMVTAVVGVGVYTFYPEPAQEVREQIEELWDREEDIGCSGAQCTAAERAELAQIRDQLRDLEDAADEEQSEWIQRTSIVLVGIATALMATSLFLGETVAILSNGILLGGLFTMLYGVGWGLASGSSVTRFVVLLVALVISLLLGYLKFTRGHAAKPSAARPRSGPPQAVDGSSVADLDSRVTELERRVAAAAESLGSLSAGAARHAGQQQVGRESPEQRRSEPQEE